MPCVYLQYYTRERAASPLAMVTNLFSVFGEYPPDGEARESRVSLLFCIFSSLKNNHERGELCSVFCRSMASIPNWIQQIGVFKCIVFFEVATDGESHCGDFGGFVVQYPAHGQNFQCLQSATTFALEQHEVAQRQ